MVSVNANAQARTVGEGAVVRIGAQAGEKTGRGEIGGAVFVKPGIQQRLDRGARCKASF